MHWSYEDVRALPLDVYDVLVEWMNRPEWATPVEDVDEDDE